MAIGNPITLTSNVASKTISVIATAGQTLFTVTGGYRINQLAVFRNGVRLLDSRDYEARNGSTVTLLSAATVGDALEFQVFDDFRVADAIVSAESEQTIQGNLNVAGILTATDLSVTDLSLRHLKATGISTVSDTTQATSTTTGAFIVSGGVGIAKSLFVGGDMSVAGTLTYEDVTNTETAGITTTGGLVVTGLGATFGSGVGIADSIYHIGDDNTAIRFPAADTFTVTTAGSERVRVSSTGKVGIGSNNPDDVLTISGTDAFIKVDRSNGNPGIDFRFNGSTTNRGLIDVTSTGDLRLSAGGNTERLRIASDGNVSIGGTEGITYSLLKGLAINTDNGDAGLVVNSSSSAHNAYIAFGYGNSGAVSHADQFSAYIGRVGDDTLAFGTGNSLRARIDSGGRLLIGATTTRGTHGGGDARLQIEGTNTATAGMSITRTSDDAGSPTFSFGKTRDGSALSDGDDVGVIYWQGDDGTDLATALCSIKGEVDGSVSGNAVPGRITFNTATTSTNLTERLRITSGGLVRVTDDASLTFGDNDDMRIYHDGGTGNYIDVYNKDFYIRCNKDAGITGGDILLQPKSGENSAVFRDNGAVELYYDNAKKLETYSEGIEILGDEGASAGIRLTADEGDDNGDSWRINSNQDVNDLTISNDTSGSYVDKLTLTTGGNLTLTGTISDNQGPLRRITYKQETSAYTLVAADAGKAIEIQGNLTVPNSVFSAGDAITIINDSSSNKTISKGTGLSYMFNTADGTNANRTLGGRGMATIYFVNSTTCYISGSQLS